MPVSKPLRTSSNSRFISRCKVKNGLNSSSRIVLGTDERVRPHGIRSLLPILTERNGVCTRPVSLRPMTGRTASEQPVLQSCHSTQEPPLAGAD
jgi:hypothetical protein